MEEFSKNSFPFRAGPRAESLKKIKEFSADHPSGIFFAYGAYRFGM